MISIARVLLVAFIIAVLIVLALLTPITALIRWPLTGIASPDMPKWGCWILDQLNNVDAWLMERQLRVIGGGITYESMPDHYEGVYLPCPEHHCVVASLPIEGIDWEFDGDYVNNPLGWRYTKD